MELSEIREQSAKAAEQVCEAAKLKIGDLFVVGWSKVKMHHLMHGNQRMTIDEYIAICQALGVPFGYFGDDTTNPASSS